MSNVGAAQSAGDIFNIDNLTGESYRNQSNNFVGKLKESLVVTHWAFANAMSEILPFAMEAVSHTNAGLAISLPMLNTANDGNRPKDQLSGGIGLSVFREMICSNRVVQVPAISFSKYSHSVGNHKIKEVKPDAIMALLKTWTDSHLSRYKEPVDYSNIVELSLLTFLEKGFQIYSGVSFNSGDRRFFRVSFLRNDMFVEMIVTMDDLFLWESLSNQERKRVMC